MSKYLVYMVGPFGTRSGYGEHARDIFHAFNKIGKYNIKLIDVRWGDTPRNALDINNKKDKLIIDCIADPNTLTQRPDIAVDIRIPNEFQPVGFFNIGITAGIETNAVSNEWIDGCNEMDLIIVPSEHSKSGFVNTHYDKMQDNPQGGDQVKIGENRVNKPIEVLFEGEDLDVWKPLKHKDIPKDFFDMINEKVPENFAFLFVGLWGKGNYGEDRKDIARLIKIFYETFAGQKIAPALIVKTNSATFSIIDKEETLNKINQIKNKFPDGVKLPNVYLLHGDLTEEEMNYLYNHPKVKSMVSFAHGEGFGRPLLEATLVGLPVVSSNWSGQLDFLDEKYSILVNGSIDNVPESQHWDKIIIPESKWFTVDDVEASKSLKFAFRNIINMKSKSKKLMEINRKKFSHDKMTDLLNSLLEKHTHKISKRVTDIKLPKLKRVKV